MKRMRKIHPINQSKGNDISKPKDIALSKSTQQNAREFLRDEALLTCDPHILLKYIDKLLIRFKSGANDVKFNAEFKKKITEALVVVSLDTHYELAQTVSPRIQPLVIDFARQIITDYGCNTASEKALAEVIAGAYSRILEYSAVLNKLTLDDHVSFILTNHYSMISKELDRANRHFISALATLQQIKSPSIEVQVKAKTAFISQAQQFNVSPSNTPTKHEYEINKPK